MSWKETVSSLATDDSITCYWEKPESWDDHAYYRIWINGEKTEETKVTHFTARHLKPDAKYLFLIEKISKEGEETYEFSASTLPAREKIDVTKPPYHAVGDGKKLNTTELQRAIEDCKKGQMVYIPAGIFLTGALKLHSDMELYIEKNGILQGTQNPEDYQPRIWSRFEGLEMECYSSVLNIGDLNHNSGYNCSNVLIRGEGTIAGGGKVLAENMIRLEKERLKEQMASLGNEINQYENENTIPGRVRPRLINISNARNIRISGLSLRDGAAWNVHMIYSDNIVTDHCSFYSLNIWNGDGWDPDSSTNCTLFDCIFHTGDDSVAIKSGKNPEGNQINKPCEHIRIFDVCCACGLGIAIGSEMSGGVKDVKIWDCDLKNTRYGIEIKGTKKRGGYVKNVEVRDSEVSRILFHSVSYNDDGIGADHPPVFSDCVFRNLMVYGKCLNDTKEKMIECTAIELCGFEEEGYEICNVKFDHMKYGFDAPISERISMKYCKNITFTETV